METLPTLTTFIGVMADADAPPRVRKDQDPITKQYRRDQLKQWYARRRHMLESQYFNWLRTHSYDYRTRPWTIEFMSRMMIQHAVSAEQDPDVRNFRRQELLRRWRNFSTKARNLANPENIV
ncbi:MAG TPA: hypothetical protein VLG16_00760 [Candidatus Saccharimonadales bacterium]|nr:hypothetical protein [Candidatus Saccharimonadales bacterium]